MRLLFGRNFKRFDCVGVGFTIIISELTQMRLNPPRPSFYLDRLNNAQSAR